MSVMMLEAESCAKIADYIGINETPEQKEKIFIELRVANINEWNRSYPDSLVGIMEAVGMLEEYKPCVFENSVQALKSLHCWRYNSDRTSSIWERVDGFIRQRFKYSDTVSPLYKAAIWG